MIENQYPQEEQIPFHYADTMGKTQVKIPLEKHAVQNVPEALVLSRFYWMIAAGPCRYWSARASSPEQRRSSTR